MTYSHINDKNVGKSKNYLSEVCSAQHLLQKRYLVKYVVYFYYRTKNLKIKHKKHVQLMTVTYPMTNGTLKKIETVALFHRITSNLYTTVNCIKLLTYQNPLIFTLSENPIRCLNMTRCEKSCCSKTHIVILKEKIMFSSMTSFKWIGFRNSYRYQKTLIEFIYCRTNRF